MRHKWNISKLSKKHPLAICKVCGCVKQIQFPVGVVYSDDKEGFVTKAPNCKIKTIK